jgi:tRNA pseudouridine38-40 synthase
VATYRIDLAYDGTGFHGFAANRGVRTIQGELESALQQVLGAAVDIDVAGRTDAGVHARHQVVSFEFAGTIDLESCERSLRSMLGPEVGLISLDVAPDGFHARFDAKVRRYRYLIANGVVLDPMQRHRVWHIETPLDLPAMNDAAAAFVGEHDFASLCRARGGRTTTRTVLEAHWERSEGLLVYEVAGAAFCHQMVRSMVALCVEVGRGRVAAEAIPGILEAKDRNAARGAAPPHGLTLWEVSY